MFFLMLAKNLLSKVPTLDTYSDQLNLLPLNNRQAVLVEGEEVKVLEDK